MTTPPKPKKVKAPEGCCGVLRAGVEYDVSEISYFGENGYYFTIISTPVEVHARERNCPHLDGQDWIVTEYEEQ